MHENMCAMTWRHDFGSLHAIVIRKGGTYSLSGLVVRRRKGGS